jgi:hypothetical protein
VAEHRGRDELDDGPFEDEQPDDHGKQRAKVAAVGELTAARPAMTRPAS